MSNPYNAPTAEMADMEGDNTYDPKIFSLSGRIGRVRWLGYHFVANIVAVFFLGILAAVMIPAMGRGGSGGGFVFIFFLLALYGVSVIYARRRLHDLDQSGWLSLLVIVPFINFFFGLYLLFAPGTEGSNSYGPAPSKQSNAIVWVIVAIPVFIAFIGILAAIAIPAYQDYVKKAHAAQLEQQQQQQQQPTGNSNN